MMYRIKSYAYSYRLEGETEGWNHKGGIWNKKKYNWIEEQMKGESVKKFKQISSMLLASAMMLSTISAYVATPVKAAFNGRK